MNTVLVLVRVSARHAIGRRPADRLGREAKRELSKSKIKRSAWGLVRSGAVFSGVLAGRRIVTKIKLRRNGVFLASARVDSFVFPWKTAFSVASCYAGFLQLLIPPGGFSGSHSHTCTYLYYRAAGLSRETGEVDLEHTFT